MGARCEQRNMVFSTETELGYGGGLAGLAAWGVDQGVRAAYRNTPSTAVGRAIDSVTPSTADVKSAAYHGLHNTVAAVGNTVMAPQHAADYAINGEKNGWFKHA